jgi:2-hydroxychromene-2-carboxylate isomerase
MEPDGMSENENGKEGLPRFEEQTGGAARLDRPHAAREIQRHIVRVVPWVLGLDAQRREFIRRIKGERHVVEFFHQVNDAYSHLALEAIGPLLDRYDVEFRFHVTSQTDLAHAPEPEMLAAYARRDCAEIAPHYDLEFSSGTEAPSPAAIDRVERLLAGLTGDPRFLKVALKAGRALWRDDGAALDEIVERVPSASEDEVAATIAAGNERRTRLRHYSGGMFWYAGEWYWGVDRLYHLERRLTRLDASRGTPGAPRFERPPLDPGSTQNEGRLSLEIFPSLRSPYTAMIFERSLRLAASVGIPIEVKPVMPMVMRGVPAPAAKGMYIMLDALREAEHIGVPFGNMYDPIGRAVERGFSLWPFAKAKGRGAEFIQSFLDAAFAEGRRTDTDEGLRFVLERAGLSFEEASAKLDREGWREELERNRRTMYDELGVWGVPSYRLKGPDGEADLCVWGQDRLWLVAAEIRRRLRAD